MEKTGKITIGTFFIAIVVLCLAKVFSSLALLLTSLGLFVLWIVLTVLEDVFDKTI